MVKAFVCGNKNDAADAYAIYLAVQQPGVKAVAIKNEGQQAVLALHRIREGLMKVRTATINALRGLLTEYGEVFGTGRRAFDDGMKGALERLEERLPAPLIDALRDQWNEVIRLDERMTKIERSLQAWLRQDTAAKAIAEIPGVGLLTATAAVATIGNVKMFRSGREFAAYIGLIPGQTGSGGKVKLLGMSKRGDTYLRTLLVHGARSVLHHSKTPVPGCSRSARVGHLTWSSARWPTKSRERSGRCSPMNASTTGNTSVRCQRQRQHCETARLLKG